MAGRSKIEQDDPSLIPHPRLSSTLYGHRAVMAAFERAMNSGQIPHAWLLVGPEGIGKATVAYHVARKLLTASSTGLFAPSEQDIAAKIAQSSHPDLLVLETSDDKTTIPVDEVRDILHLMRHTPYESYRRIVIIDPIEALNPNAANALLKILEEPPSHAIFFLISHHPNALLPTIRSRCLMVHMHPPSRQDTLSIMRSIQADIPAHETEAYLSLANDAAGYAIQLAKVKGLTIYKECLHYLLSLKTEAVSWSQPLLAFMDVTSLPFILDTAFSRAIKYASHIPFGDYLINEEEALLANITGKLSIEMLLNVRNTALEQLALSDKVHLDKPSIIRSLCSYAE
ncbi:MAG: AAA family ATPase [Alphaproteobacteria bacterium]|nr:AAA family ATPase [Alphaproteobacteria bacterium]